jgi:MipA family protein
MSPLKSISHILATIFTICVVAFSPAAAQSQTLSDEEMEDTNAIAQRNWNFTAGAGIGYGPTYLGSKKFQIHPIFLGSANYRNSSFIGPAGLGVNLLNIKGLNIGPVISYQGGRHEDSDPHLSGLGNIQASFLAGGFLAYHLGAFEFIGTARQAITHSNNGLIGRVQLDYRLDTLAKSLELNIGPELDLGDGRYEKKWFGVSSSQSLLSGLPVFSPKGGITAEGAYVTLDYHFSRHVFLRLFGNFRELADNDSESPIVEDRTQAFVGLGLAYTWGADSIATAFDHFTD